MLTDVRLSCLSCGRESRSSSWRVVVGAVAGRLRLVLFVRWFATGVGPKTSSVGTHSPRCLINFSILRFRILASSIVGSPRSDKSISGISLRDIVESEGVNGVGDRGLEDEEEVGEEGSEGTEANAVHKGEEGATAAGAVVAAILSEGRRRIGCCAPQLACRPRIGGASDSRLAN